MTNNLFGNNYEVVKPLAMKLRPQSLEDFIGQEKTFRKGGILRKLIERQNISNSIFLWTTWLWKKFSRRDNF